MKPWLLLAGSVVAIDVWLVKRKAPTLSACYRQAYRTPIGRPLVVGITAGLVAHLIEGS